MQTFVCIDTNTHTYKINAEVQISEEKSGGSVMLFGGICWQGTADQYNILTDNIFPMIKHFSLKRNSLFQKDSVPIDGA